MENTKIGNKEAIALLTTISFNQIIIFGVKSIINNTSSASLLNLLYLSIIILIFTILICYLLNKFPSFDLLDISDYLGGKILNGLLEFYFLYILLFLQGIHFICFLMFRNNIFSFNSTDFYKIIFNNRCYYYLLIQK
jgi:hypothetical protein